MQIRSLLGVAVATALLIVGLFQLSVLTFHRLPAWQAFGAWLAS